MIENKYFSGAQDYLICEDEYREEAEYLKELDPLVYKRIEFRREFLNPIVCRIGDAHSKINLGWFALIEYNKKLECDKKQGEFSSGKVTLEVQLVGDIINSNLLKMALVIEELYIGFNKSIHPQFGQLFRRISKDKLKNIIDNEQNYSAMRLLLFENEEKNQINVTCEKFSLLSKKVEVVAEKIKDFRDKVIAHSNDKKRFKTHLAYEEYLLIHDDVVKYLNAISVVATFRHNDWAFIEKFDQSSKAKNWLIGGLIASIMESK